MNGKKIVMMITDISQEKERKERKEKEKERKVMEFKTKVGFLRAGHPRLSRQLSNATKPGYNNIPTRYK